MSLALVLLTNAGQSHPARAAEVLANPGFNGLTSWTVSGSFSAPGGCSCAEASGPLAVISQTGGATPNASYVARMTVTPLSGSVTGTLSVELLDGGFTPLAVTGVVHTATASAPLQLLATAPAHPSAAHFRVRLQVSAPADATFRITGASVQETAGAPPPTSTPPATATPPNTPPATAIPTPTRTPTQTASPGATPTPRPASTSTPTPRPTSTPRPTPTPRPGSPPPTPRATPTPLPAIPTPTPSGPNIGGLLTNGGFEIHSDGAPSGWSKVGGTLTSAFGGYAGQRAGSLYSQTTSTKWVYQSVGVTPGNWYRASAMARISAGSGEIFIRVSWYASANGSGSALAQQDGNVTSSGGWASLSTGPIQVPAGANSARVRFMLRPSGPVTALFDQAMFVASSPPPPEPTPTSTGTPVPGSSATHGPTSTPQPGSTPTPRTPVGTGSGGNGGSGAGSSGAGSSGSSGGRSTIPPPRADGPAPTGPLALALSEVASDTAESGNDGEYEWVEVVNHGTEPVDLQGWSLGDAIREDVLPSLAIPPGGYAVIAGPLAALPEDIPVVRVPDGTIGAGLNNGGDAVRLIAPGGTLVDAMSFGENTSVFDPAPPAPGPGESLATDGPRGGWMLSAVLTPGGPNAFPEPAEPEAPTPGADAPGSPAAAEAAGEDNETPTINQISPGSPLPGYLLAATAGAGAVALAVAGRSRLARKWPRGN